MLTTIRREIESYLNNSISKTWEISVASCLDIRKLTSCTYTTFSKEKKIITDVDQQVSEKKEDSWKKQKV